MEHLIIVYLLEQYQGLINLYLDKLRRCYLQAKSNVGFYIESHILERNKQKVVK